LQRDNEGPPAAFDNFLVAQGAAKTRGRISK
jgi:hypothetical protein